MIDDEVSDGDDDGDGRMVRVVGVEAVEIADDDCDALLGVYSRSSCD